MCGFSIWELMQKDLKFVARSPLTPQLWVPKLYKTTVFFFSFVLFPSVFVFFFSDRVTLYNSRFPGTHSVDRLIMNSRDLPAPGSWD